VTNDDPTLTDLTDQPGGLNLGNGVRLIRHPGGTYTYEYDGPKFP